MRRYTDGYVVIFEPDSPFKWKAYIPEKWTEYLVNQERKNAGEMFVYPLRPAMSAMAYTRIGLELAVRNEEKRAARKLRRTQRLTGKALRRGWAMK